MLKLGQASINVVDMLRCADNLLVAVATVTESRFASRVMV